MTVAAVAACIMVIGSITGFYFLRQERLAAEAKAAQRQREKEAETRRRAAV